MSIGYQTFVILLQGMVFLQVAAFNKYSWQAEVIISNDPRVAGSLTGTFYYLMQQPMTPTSVKRYRIDYNLGRLTSPPQLGPYEIYDEVDQIRYLYCTAAAKCEAESVAVPVPRLYVLKGDKRSPDLDYGICKAYQRLLNTEVDNVDYLWVQGEGSNETPCKVQMQNGKTYEFSKFADNRGDMKEYLQWKCPQKQCSLKIDMMLVLDESGSISVNNFSTMKDFSYTFANTFDINPLGVMLGVVTFDSIARMRINLSANKANVLNTISGMTQHYGGTCIPCGIQAAETSILTYGRPLTTGVTRVMIVLTDGQNINHQDIFSSSIKHAKEDSQIMMFAIGVGIAVNYQAQMQEIASDIPGVQTVFSSNDFDGLADILDDLIQATCLEISATPCGTGCKGFCSCEAVCMCPDKCDQNGECTVPRCDFTTGFGCGLSKKKCDDGDYCTTDTCKEPVGCQHPATNCDDGNPCTTDSCNPAVGCVFTPVPCDDGQLCTSDTFDPKDPQCCVHTPVPNCKCIGKDCSNAPGLCNPYCDPEDGTCKSNCPASGNICSPNICNTTSLECQLVRNEAACDDGDSCTIDTCEANEATGQTGCSHTPVDCNDFDVCTNETCDSTVVNEEGNGCVYTPKTCDDGNPCTINTCNQVQYGAEGCGFPQRNCTNEFVAAGFKIPNDCVLAVCNGAAGCTLEHIEGAYDQCNECHGNGQSCVLGTEQVIVLGGAVTAALVAAIIALIAAAGIFGGKKGFDLYRKTQGSMGGAQGNPLYKDSDNQGSNALYTE